ncbi:MAG: hypothetical protein IEMM0008_1850 [bacterium]|nr:MAG: hypothetical protein IEMM0008_1850 [bacterium]
MNHPVTQDKKKQTGTENIHWNLDDLYKSIDDPSIQADLRGGEKAAEVFVRNYKGNIDKLDPDGLKKAYKELEGLLSPLSMSMPITLLICW